MASSDASLDASPDTSLREDKPVPGTLRGGGSMSGGGQWLRTGSDESECGGAGAQRAIRPAATLAWVS